MAHDAITYLLVQSKLEHPRAEELYELSEVELTVAVVVKLPRTAK